MKVLAKILYGSQNYHLASETSDKDYIVIAAPDANDLFYERHIQKLASWHAATWDVRKFFGRVLKANVNALELVCSSEQQFFDDDFELLMKWLNKHLDAIVYEARLDFFACVRGILYNIVDKEPKRLAYAQVLHDAAEDFARTEQFSFLVPSKAYDVKFNGTKPNLDFSSKALNFYETAERDTYEPAREQMENWWTRYLLKGDN